MYVVHLGAEPVNASETFAQLIYSMSVTAKQLNKARVKGTELDAIVREHLQIIDTRLLEHARTWGLNIVVYDLPVNFSLPGLDKKDCQRIIYSSIIRSLSERGFDVRISLDSERTALYIRWVTSLEQKEVTAMTKLIRDHRIDHSELEAWLAGPAEGPGPEKK